MTSSSQILLEKIEDLIIDSPESSIKLREYIKETYALFKEGTLTDWQKIQLEHDLPRDFQSNVT